MNKKDGTQRSLETQVASVKRDLVQWLDQIRCSASGAALTIALLEIALDQYLAGRTGSAADLAPTAADALDMIQPILRRAVQRRRLALHGITREPAINEEDLAERLTEMLKLL